MKSALQIWPPPERGRSLTFAPLAWLKLLWVCHAGDTEVGGFGVSAARDLLRIEDFVPVRQWVSPLSVRFEDSAVADYFDCQVDQDVPPECFGRVWIHTHPGNSPLPSSTDEQTFARSFGGCEWALMVILARQGQTYARLTFRAGPGGDLLLPVTVAWDGWPQALEQTANLDALVESWRRLYGATVQHEPLVLTPPRKKNSLPEDQASPWYDREPWCEELDGFVYEPTYQGGPHEPPY